MKISVVGFDARDGENILEQADNCLEQLNDFLTSSSLKLENVISLNFFTSNGSNGHYRDQTEELRRNLPDNITKNIPVAVIAQAPASGSLVAAEVHYLPNPGESTFTPRMEQGQLYLVIHKGDEKLVIANGIQKKTEPGNTTDEAEKVFSIMEGMLASEGLDFGNIFRQWNYIEGITVVDGMEELSKQNYQQFNNVRTRYYASSSFENGYPAATGIGVNAGGVIVSFFAVSGNNYTTASVENPLQKAAYKYSEEVLIGNTEYEGFIKCTPKFARAKLLSNGESKQVFISGTASIREQETIGENDVEQQTEVTLENIQNLVSSSTLSQIKTAENELPEIKFIRVYIKFPEDYSRVMEICEKQLPGVPSIYVVSDVCREDLLVEIEALATF